ncbi:TPA: glycosyltransferase family 2 protein [Proteus mirabilis]
MNKITLPLLSIVIPCYNVENYIIDCLESLFKQIDDKCELIIINDGSTDNTDKIITSYLKNIYNENIFYVRQNNNGLSATRNKGIKLSTGKYIAFLDSDDIWLPNSYEKIIEKLNLNIDILEFDAIKFNKHFAEKSIFYTYLKSKNENFIYKKNDILQSCFVANTWYVWSRIYKKDIFKNEELFFENGRRYEDIMFTPYIYLNENIKKISILKHIVVGYRYNDSSITKMPMKNDIQDIIYAIQKLMKNKNTHLTLYPIIKYWLIAKEIDFKINNSITPDINLLTTRKIILKNFKIPKNITIVEKRNLLFPRLSNLLSKIKKSLL